MKHFVRFVLLCGLVFCCLDARAASLSGKVIEVQSGDVISVFNLNRAVRVKLLGIDAPEVNQAFGDVARKHLSDLIYDKTVSVEYSGISADHSVAGRVLLDSRDVGAQMIRDGVAWFDPGSVNQLSATDREVYRQSEQAARNERRGLWQDENPVAPWEFVRGIALPKNPTAQLNSNVPPTKTSAKPPVAELTNLSLMGWGGSSAGREEVNPEGFARASSATPKTWQEFRPAGEDFSIFMPDQGFQKTVQENAGDEMVDVHSYLVREGWASYVVTWANGPTHGKTEESVFKEILDGALKGAKEGYRNLTQESFACGAMPRRSISMNGYAGREFDLTSCTLPMKVRVYVRINGERTQVYFAVTMFAEEDQNIARFLNSFRVGHTQSGQSKKR